MIGCDFLGVAGFTSTCARKTETISPETLRPSARPRARTARRSAGAMRTLTTVLVLSSFMYLFLLHLALHASPERSLPGASRAEADDGELDEQDEPVGARVASAVSGQVPPAGPQWVRGLAVPAAHALLYDEPLCASLDGFTLHAATRAGGSDDNRPRGAAPLRAPSSDRATVDQQRSAFDVAPQANECPCERSQARMTCRRP